MDYKPDARIVKQLKAYDPYLSVRWDRGRERWVLYYRDWLVSIVQNQDGSFRPLDERLIVHTMAIDAWKHKDGAAMMRVMNEHNHQLDLKQKRAFSEMVRETAMNELHFGMFGPTTTPVGIDLKGNEV